MHLVTQDWGVRESWQIQIKKERQIFMQAQICNAHLSYILSKCLQGYKGLVRLLHVPLLQQF